MGKHNIFQDMTYVYQWLINSWTIILEAFFRLITFASFLIGGKFVSVWTATREASTDISADVGTARNVSLALVDIWKWTKVICHKNYWVICITSEYCNFGNNAIFELATVICSEISKVQSSRVVLHVYYIHTEVNVKFPPDIKQNTGKQTVLLGHSENPDALTWSS